MPEYWDKLIKFYGGTNQTFKQIKNVEKGIKRQVEEWIISYAESEQRLKMLSKFKKTLQFYTNSD